ncbi:hypothetical protein KBZ22_14135, partial [Cyanobium sp. L1E-Cus]|nr:hypothetical protein [Cyanobium sp. L1E-Cus]
VATAMVTIKVPTAISGISRAQNKRFYRSTRLTPHINLIDTGQVITRRGEEETTFLLRSPANAQRLLRSIACLNSGGGEEHDLLPCN